MELYFHSPIRLHGVSRDNCALHICGINSRTETISEEEENATIYI